MTHQSHTNLPVGSTIQPDGATGTLSVTTHPSPLAVTVFDHQMRVVAEGVSPKKFELAPGLYMIRASRVGVPDLTRFAWVVSKSDRAVFASADSPGLVDAASSLLTGIIDKYVRKLPSLAPHAVSEALPQPELPAAPFWIRFLALKDWDHAERMELPKFSTQFEHGRATLELTNPHSKVVFAQLGRTNLPVLNVAMPPAGALRPTRCELVVSSHASSIGAYVRLSTEWANAGMRYMSEGYLDQAKQLVLTATSRQATGLAGFFSRIANRFDDPAAALVPRYLGLRTREDTIFSTLGEFVIDNFRQDLSDGLIIAAEMAARERKYKLALTTILGIPSGGLPLFTEGFSILGNRARELADLEREDITREEIQESQLKDLKLLLRRLNNWAPYIRLNSPTLTFRGSDIAAPSEAEAQVLPSERDGWLAISTSE